MMALIPGTLLGMSVNYGVVSIWVMIITATAFVVALFLCLKSYRNFSIIVIIFILFFDISFAKSNLYVSKQNIFYNALTDGESIVLSGTIDRQYEKNDKYYYVVKCDSFNGENCNYKGIIKNDYSIDNIFPGTYVKLTGVVSAFNEASNNGEFDEKSYYFESGISFKICNAKLNDNSVLHNQFKKNIFIFKQSLLNQLNKICPEKYKGVYKGILLGDKNEMDADIKDIYQSAGISHIMAISGLHVAILGMTIYRILRWLMGIRISSITSITCMLVYILMIGGSVSAYRAFIMFVLILLADVVGRSYDAITAVCFAFSICILENPLCILSEGLLLSFGAVLGIVVVYDLVKNILSPKYKITKSLLGSLCVNLVTIPILEYSFYQINLYSVFINLLVIPFMAFVVGFGVMALCFSYFSVFFGKIIIFAGCGILFFYEKVCSLFLKLPNAIVITGKPSILKLFVYYLILIFLIIVMKIISAFLKNDNLKISLKTRVILFLWVPILIIAAVINKSPNFKVSIIDVGQGDSICIRNKNTVILIDSGSTSNNLLEEYVMIPFFKAEGISKIDYAVVTHADSDHYNAMIKLLGEKINGKSLIKNLVVQNIDNELIDENYKELISEAQLSGINIIRIDKGDCIKTEEIRLDCLWPDKNIVASDKNESSIVFNLNYKDFDMLLTGDLGKEGEEYLLEQDYQIELKDVDVLKVGHHGSKNSSTKEFLEKLQPEIGVISCGKNNNYGHPHNETLERLKEADCRIYRTDLQGCVTISIGCNDKKLKVIPFRGRMHAIIKKAINIKPKH